VKMLGLRARLTLIFIFAFAGILILVTGAFYRILKFRLEENLRSELTERAAGLRGYLHFKDGKPGFEYDENDPGEAFFVETSTRYYQIFNQATGDLVDQSHELDLLNWDADPENRKPIQGSSTFSNEEAGSVKLLFHNEVVRSPQGPSFLLQIGLNRNPIDAALRQFLLMALFVVPAGLAVASVASWWVAGRALQPINVLAQTATEIGISGLDRRLPLRGAQDELDRLSITFNDMFARLAKAIGEMKQFTASISHELRTPITVLQGEAEVMLMQPHPVEEYRSMLASHLEEYGRLTRLINKLLTLARADAGEIQMTPKIIDLAQFTRDLVDQLTLVACSKQVSLAIRSNGPAYVKADREWLESAILNLLDNAIKYTPEEGKVTVVVENQGSQQKLEIQDTGIGISSKELPHIFERFYRADSSCSGKCSGAGLGLSLVQWIVRQHGGRIEVRSEPEKGSCFTIWLPAETESVGL
jgi:heavy metal sensor kinase